jgi:hypothetical protein
MLATSTTPRSSVSTANRCRNALLDKAPQLPADIHWHFIGHLQTNKVAASRAFNHQPTTVLCLSIPQVKSLLSLPNLACVESVDRAKLAGVRQCRA